MGEVRAAITLAVTRDHGVAPAVVHLGPMGAIPLTTSGKVRRQACKQAFQQGSLSTLEARSPLPHSRFPLSLSFFGASHG